MIDSKSQTLQRFLSLVAMSIGAMMLGACSTTASAVRVDQADSGPPRCKAFAWHSQSKDAASLTEQRVRTAAMTELERKGYAQSDSADCRISFVLATHEAAKSRPSVGVGAGGGSGGIGGGIGVSLPIGKRDKYAGTFTMDVIDSARNAQVWSGAIDIGLRDAEPTEEEVREAVRVVLAEFPGAAQ